MKISWLGHSCFLLESVKGTKIITDPYEPGGYSGAIGYGPINIEPDIVTVSHQHSDHNFTRGFKRAKIIDKPRAERYKDVSIEAVESFHDDMKGRDRGNNIIFIFELEGLRLAHFGDLGTRELDFQNLKNLDIIMIPVGGTFTLGPKEAQEVVGRLKPKITIPMHFKTEKLGFNIEGKESFLRGKDFHKKDFLEVNTGNIKDYKPIVVLNHQR
ncbi:MAG: MBL fold metallo-hydrolase [Candidatus Omnitrophica bacterium]|nr:MBL fold metallo-hydrolase [Candidatus Omnitrophota bacterium]